MVIKKIFCTWILGMVIVSFGQLEMSAQCTESDSIDVSFTALPDICYFPGIQPITGLGGGFPEGGVYSGPGVTDDGNGMTYSYDPELLGPGTYELSYTFSSEAGSTLNPENSSTSTVRPAAAGCACEGECEKTVYDQVIVYQAETVDFSAPEGFFVNEGLQTGLEGGFPLGGIYEGPGVTDEGNGETFTFDPEVIGPGMYELSYTYMDTLWAQQGATIFGDSIQDISEESISDGTGFSVSLSSTGTRMVIGSPGKLNTNFRGLVRVYEFEDFYWKQLGEDILGEQTGDKMGWSVSLSSDGTRLAAGAPLNEGGAERSGHVRVFQWEEDKWVQLGEDIDGFSAGEGEVDGFGTVVSISSDGNRLAIGAPDLADRPGQIRVYDWNGSSWNKIGQTIDGALFGGFSELAISLAPLGDRLAIGAPLSDENGEHAGGVWIYEFESDMWIPKGEKIMGKSFFGEFGASVALSSEGNRLVVGAPLSEGGSERSGLVQIFEWEGSAWVQVGGDIEGLLLGEEEVDGLGSSVAISYDGNRVAAAAPDLADRKGTVRLYEWTGEIWKKIDDSIGELEGGEFSHVSISLSADGTGVGIGATGDVFERQGEDHVRVFMLDGCSNTATDSIEVFSEPVSSADFLDPGESQIFAAYPNPFESGVKVRIRENLRTSAIFELINSYGQRMEHKVVLAKADYYLGKNLPEGVYFLRVHYQGSSQMIKLIKSR